jgi:hypothetical protein
MTASTAAPSAWDLENDEKKKIERHLGSQTRTTLIPVEGEGKAEDTGAPG